MSAEHENEVELQLSCPPRSTHQASAATPSTPPSGVFWKAGEHIDAWYGWENEPVGRRRFTRLFYPFHCLVTSFALADAIGVISLSNPHYRECGSTCDIFGYACSSRDDSPISNMYFDSEDKAPLYDLIFTYALSEENLFGEHTTKSNKDAIQTRDAVSSIYFASKRCKTSLIPRP